MSRPGTPKSRWRGIALVVVCLATFVFGTAFFEELFGRYVSRGLAFVLTSAAMMLVIVALGSLFGLRQAALPDGGKKNKYGPVFKAVLFLIVIGAALSWSALAYIETNALSQPDHATGDFVVAVHPKGVLRFMTLDQYRIDEIASWTFPGCILMLLALNGIGTFLRRKRDGR